MNYEEKMRAAADNRRDRAKVGAEVLELKKMIETATRTIFIGNLARCEKYLGRVWGHGSENKSQSQLDWNKVWTRMREDILDFSNKQLRILLKKLEHYRVEKQQQL